MRICALLLLLCLPVALALANNVPGDTTAESRALLAAVFDEPDSITVLQLESPAEGETCKTNCLQQQHIRREREVLQSADRLEIGRQLQRWLDQKDDTMIFCFETDFHVEVRSAGEVLDLRFCSLADEMGIAVYRGGSRDSLLRIVAPGEAKAVLQRWVEGKP